MDLSDTARAIWSAHRFGLIATVAWPFVAAHLIADGLNGNDTVAMAALPANPSRWDVEPLIPGIWRELGATECPDAEAALVAARLLAMVTPNDEGLLERLAALASSTGYDIEPFWTSSLILDITNAGFPPDQWPALVSLNPVPEVRALGPLNVDLALLPYLTGITGPRS
jgi:hypothetical protein